MKFSSGRAFKEWPQRAVTVFGMSGVGKTSLAQVLRRESWFHYSVDYRIGTRYLGEEIVDNFKREAMKTPLLRSLLMSDSITISSNIRFENLSPLSTFLGAPGDPEKEGLSFAEFKRRQELHRKSEIAATIETESFIGKSRDIYGYEHFICDASGSLCEIVDPDDQSDPVLNALAASTILVYIRGPKSHTHTLVDRFRANPKPMYYNPKFLEEKWAEYLHTNQTRPERVDPSDFAIWGFEALIKRRQPIYELIAENWGYTIEMSDIAQISTARDFIERLGAEIDRKSTK